MKKLGILFAIILLAPVVLSPGPTQAQGGTLYLVEAFGAHNLYQVNTATGAVTQIGGAGGGGNTYGLALSNTPGTFLFGGGGTLPTNLRQIATDGSGVTPVGNGNTYEGLAYDSVNGVLYGINGGSGFGTVNQTTGAFTDGGFADPVADLEGLAYDSTRQVIWGIGNSANLWQYAIATNSWSFAAINGGVTNWDESGLAYDPGTDTLYAISRFGSGITRNNLYSINPTTAAATLIGPTGLTPNSYGLTFAPAVAPPPAFGKNFAPASVPYGGTSTLTFNINNSASGTAATSLDFTDNLPAGVLVASPNNASTTCTGGTLTAVSGTGIVSHSGGSVGANASCTVTVDVAGISGGSHLNTSGDLTSSAGNSGPAADTLTVTVAVGGVTFFIDDAASVAGLPVMALVGVGLVFGAVALGVVAVSRKR